MEYWVKTAKPLNYPLEMVCNMLKYVVPYSNAENSIKLSTWCVRISKKTAKCIKRKVVFKKMDKMVCKNRKFT